MKRSGSSAVSYVSSRPRFCDNSHDNPLPLLLSHGKRRYTSKRGTYFLTDENEFPKRTSIPSGSCAEARRHKMRALCSRCRPHVWKLVCASLVFDEVRTVLQQLVPSAPTLRMTTFGHRAVEGNLPLSLQPTNVRSFLPRTNRGGLAPQQYTEEEEPATCTPPPVVVPALTLSKVKSCTDC